MPMVANDRIVATAGRPARRRARANTRPAALRVQEEVVPLDGGADDDSAEDARALSLRWCDERVLADTVTPLSWVGSDGSDGGVAMIRQWMLEATSARTYTISCIIVKPRRGAPVVPTILQL